jgi:hypothetical protein
MTWRGPQEHANETDPEARSLRGMIRRALIGLTQAGGVAAGIWQVLGPKFEGKRDTQQAEAWQGIGFASRPRAGHGEAIVVAVGAAGKATGGAPAIVATRDEGLRQLAAAVLGEDETATFNSKATVAITAGGAIEARSIGGTAHDLALKADVQAIRGAITTAINALTAAVQPSPELAALAAALDAIVTWPVGTTVLKGE